MRKGKCPCCNNVQFSLYNVLFVINDQILLWMCFVIVFYTLLSVPCGLVVTCWERDDLLALLCVMISCVFVTFPCGILGRVWYLIAWTPDICISLNFYTHNGNKNISYEPWHEISNNVVCATSKASDQPAHTRSLIRAFASRLHIL